MSASETDGAPALTPKPSPLGAGGGLRELLSEANFPGSPLPSPLLPPAGPSSSLAGPTAAATGSLASSQQYRHRLSLMDADGEIAR